jgi:hypothetical protein
MVGDGWQSIFEYGDIHNVMWHSTLFYILSIAIYQTSNSVRRCRPRIYRLPYRTEYNSDYNSTAQIKCQKQWWLRYRITRTVTMQIIMLNKMKVRMRITIPNTMPYLFRSYITENPCEEGPDSAWVIPTNRTTMTIDDYNWHPNQALPIDVP